VHFVRRHEGHRQRSPRSGFSAELDVFTEWKSIYVDYSGKLKLAQRQTQRVSEPSRKKMSGSFARGDRDDARGVVAEGRPLGDRRLRALLWYTAGTGTS